MGKLVTDELPLEMNRDFRNDLVDNFKKLDPLVSDGKIAAGPANIIRIVEILKKYDGPIGFDAIGNVVDLGEEEG